MTLHKAEKLGILRDLIFQVIAVITVWFFCKTSYSHHYLVLLHLCIYETALGTRSSKMLHYCDRITQVVKITHQSYREVGGGGTKQNSREGKKIKNDILPVQCVHANVNVFVSSLLVVLQSVGRVGSIIRFLLSSSITGNNMQ